jgi:hypothetical protein
MSFATSPTKSLIKRIKHHQFILVKDAGGIRQFNFPINTVDLNKSHIVVNGWSKVPGGAGSDATSGVIRFLNSTTVYIRIDSTSALDWSVAFSVVEYN